MQQTLTRSVNLELDFTPLCGVCRGSISTLRYVSQSN